MSFFSHRIPVMDLPTFLSHLDSPPMAFRPGPGPCGGRFPNGPGHFRGGPGHCGRGPNNASSGPGNCSRGPPSARHGPGSKQACSKRSGASVHPPFDVREVTDAYELQGELPGVELADVHVEFADAQTLVISGRIERPSTAAVKGTTNESAEKTAEEDEEDLIASEYHQVTVEDEQDEDNSPAENEGASSAMAEPAADEPKTDTADTDITWVRERAFGPFRRSFTFAALLDQAGVQASLRNGVLSVHVPKKAVERRAVVVQEG